MMSRETMTDVMTYIGVTKVKNLDITGGAPELHPHFRELVVRARELGVHVIDRCNLTILEEPGQEGLAQFLAAHEVEIIASLPCYTEELVDRQRGKGVYDKSIRALKRLNAAGYGSRLTLNLVYNPQGPSLPPAQDKLEADYKRILGETHGIVFNRLFTLANMPIQRFGAILLSKGEFDTYLDKLCVGPVAAGRVDIRLPPRENLARIATELRRSVSDITVVILERERHAGLISEVRATT